jgi:uncharacterized repeat protein (TIGR03843 family)
MGEDLGFDAAERLLRDAEFGDCRLLPYSSNYVYVAQMCAAGDARFAAIYKPLGGENPLWDFPDGQLYKREAAAYELSRLLGWPMVPPTVVRYGPEGVGSLQLYVRHDPEAHFFVQRDNAELIPQLKRMCVFDVIANNADRKGGHCLLDEHGRIWGIDHGLCFHPQYKLRSVMWDWVAEPIESALIADLETALEQLESSADQASKLLHLLQPGEPGALMKRMRKLLSEAAFPAPGPNRHYPWPLV